MNYQKLKNSRQVNQLFEYRYFNQKFLNEDVRYSMQPDGDIKKIIKLVDGVPEQLTDEEITLTKGTEFKKEESVLKAIEKLNQKFGNYV